MGIGIPFVFPGVDGVKCLFQTPDTNSLEDNLGQTISVDQQKGFSARKKLLQHIGLSTMAEAEQVHGDEILFEPKPVCNGKNIDPSVMCKADGLATMQKGFGLLIKTADCQPILFTDRSGKYIAAIHVGWKGNRIHFPETAVKVFCEKYNCSAQDIFAVRGPSLSPACAQFTDFDAEWGSSFRPWYSEDQKTMDLWSLTKDQLVAGGMVSEHIFSIDLCTYSLQDVFFSYRRKDAGRQGSLIWIE